MKKKLLQMVYVITVFACIAAFNMTVAEAKTPASDTWVMFYGMSDYYVKAGSLERIGSYHPDAAPSFRATVITVIEESPRKVSTDTYEFIAKGDVRVSVNGKFHSMTSQNKLTNRLYNAIVNTLF